jgi:hypothetical protein
MIEAFGCIVFTRLKLNIQFGNIRPHGACLAHTSHLVPTLHSHNADEAPIRCTCEIPTVLDNTTD